MTEHEHRAGCASEAWDGRPESPERDGWHWFKDRAGALFVAKWHSDGEYYVRHYSDTPYEFAAPNGWAYLGPCLMPDEAAALRANSARLNVKAGQALERRIKMAQSLDDTATQRDALAARLKVADGLLTRSEEELRLIRMKDTGAIYDTLLRLDLRAVLTPAAGDAP